MTDTGKRGRLAVLGPQKQTLKRKKMHYTLLAVTTAKPTETVLETLLRPFMPEKLDWWALGGRYTGLIEPYELTGTLTGGYDITDTEIGISRLVEEAAVKAGVEPESPRKRGSGADGVDAAQISNIKDLKAGTPAAVLVHGKWIEEPLDAMMGLFLLNENLRLRPGAEPLDISPSQSAAMKKWHEDVFGIIDGLRGSEWLAVVDFHR
jgi:hypothetical protein